MLDDLIGRLVHERASREAAELERACEKALQGGQHGVLVRRDLDGASIATVDASVPYGEVHHRPL